MSRALRRSVPLKTMCSSKCETPILSGVSWADAVRIQNPAAAERSDGIVSVRTTSPFGPSVRRTPSSSFRVCTLLLDQRLARQPHLAAVVDLQELHRDD